MRRVLSAAFLARRIDEPMTYREISDRIKETAGFRPCNSTLHRHLAALVEAGTVAKEDHAMPTRVRWTPVVVRS